MPASLGEGPLQGHRVLIVASSGKRVRELCVCVAGGSSVIRALITFKKAPPLDTIALRDRVSTQEFWRGHVQTIPVTHGGINCNLQAGELLSPPHTNPVEILYDIERSGESMSAPSLLTGNLAVT